MSRELQLQVLRADLGRALRSAYDDTLREAVPDEFLDILGKLR